MVHSQERPATPEQSHHQEQPIDVEQIEREVANDENAENVEESPSTPFDRQHHILAVPQITPSDIENPGSSAASTAVEAENRSERSGSRGSDSAKNINDPVKEHDVEAGSPSTKPPLNTRRTTMLTNATSRAETEADLDKDERPEDPQRLWRW